MSVSQDLNPTLQLDVTPPLSQAAAAPKGVRFVASRLRKLIEWRAFLSLQASSSYENKPKLLTHSGHGSVSILHSDIPPGRAVSALTTRMTIRRITGAPSLGRERITSSTRCPLCGLTASIDESLERHVVRCPNGGMRHRMHYGVVQVLKSIIKDVGIPEISVVTEARGLRSSDASRPGDVVVLDFFKDGQHLVIDVVVTMVYRNTILQQVSTIPGYAAKQAEERKLYANKSSAQPVASIHGGSHVQVPFALEYGGRLGAHAQALFRSFATLAIEKGRCPPLAYRDPSSSAPHSCFPVGPEMAAAPLHLEASCSFQASPSHPML